MDGLLFWGGIIIACAGAPVLGIIFTVIGLIMIFDDSEQRTNQIKKNQEIQEETKKSTTVGTTSFSQSNLYGKPKSDNFEVYVQVKFDDYHKIYTYLAPTNRFLKNGERIRIMTHEGIKTVTVVKGNYKCPKKTDMYYKRIDIR